MSANAALFKLGYQRPTSSQAKKQKLRQPKINTTDTLCLVCGAHRSTKSKLGCSPQWFSPLACRRRRVRASPPARC